MATSETRVTLIQCTNSKRPSACAARHLYDPSAYFRKMRAWAKARGNPWFILSAKHGLLHPDTTVEPYDERGLTETQTEAIAEKLYAWDVTVVDVTAGRDYTDPLTPACEWRGIDVIEHFAGEPIGRRQQLLAAATQELTHETL